MAWSWWSIEKYIGVQLEIWQAVLTMKSLMEESMIVHRFDKMGRRRLTKMTSKIDRKDEGLSTNYAWIDEEIAFNYLACERRWNVSGLSFDTTHIDAPLCDQYADILVRATFCILLQKNL